MDNHTRARVSAPATSRLPLTPGPDDGPLPPAPMRILDARRHITFDGTAQLTVLVDRIPRIEELTFRPVDLGRVRPVPGMVLYVGQHPSGYVATLVDIGDRRGFYGQTFHLRLDDGTVRRVVGPYRGSFDLIELFASDMGIRTDVGVLDDGDSFARHRDGRGALDAGLTPAAARTALELAIRRGISERARPTRAFENFAWLTAPAPPPDDRGRSSDRWSR